MLKSVTPFICLALVTQTFDASSIELSKIEEIGKKIFFDDQLSEPVGQSCSTCHQPDKAFASNLVVNPGAKEDRFTNRNAPSLAYISLTPSFRYETIEGNVVPVGGLFWDGRVDSLKEQALEPFLNPLEMGNLTEQGLLNKIKTRPYFNELLNLLSLDALNEQHILKAVRYALQSYQSSSEFNKFNSKYDQWLKGQAKFTLEERQGMLLFERIDKGNCAACHTLKRQHVHDKPLLTDFTYDNIGVPKNANNPFYQVPETVNPLGFHYIDYGLGNTARMKDQRYLGMFKVPTLRNIDLTAPYMHNGVFLTLKEVVEFYNSRDNADQWGNPEVPYNVNDTELGNLSLTEIEIEALVAFMKTLTDDYEEDNK